MVSRVKNISEKLLMILMVYVDNRCSIIHGTMIFLKNEGLCTENMEMLSDLYHTVLFYFNRRLSQR